MKYVPGAVVAIVAALAWVGSADAQYTGTLSGGNVTFDGGANGDSLILGTDPVGGFLIHNRPMAEGFAAPNDLNSTAGGIQSLLVSALTSLTVNAGDGNDTVVLTALTGVPGGATVVIGGDGGNDILTGGPANETFNGGPGDDLINPGSANAETNVVNGDSGTDSLVLTGDLGNNAIAVSRTGSVLAISIDGNVSNATYSGLETLSITGLDGNDTFTCQPLNDLAYTLDGGTGADTLNIDAGGNLVVQNANSVTVAGSMPIVHSNFETVNVANQGFGLGGGGGSHGCGLTGLEGLLPLILGGFLRLSRRK